jgi:5-methylthioadenosine/S-adenosylhomocysteine deaminase
VASREKFGKREVEHLEDLGVLGPNFLGAHSVTLSDKEAMLLAKHKAAIATSPVANTGYMQGIAKVPLMKELGVTVSLGSDNIAGGTGHFTLMKQLNFVHRGYWGYEYEDPFVLEPEDVLEIATINGAKALLWDKEIGSLEAGKKADIITVSLNSPHMTPCYDIVAKLTWVAENSDVDTIIIDGKVVMENREVKTMDEEEVLKTAARVSDEILSRAKVSKFRKPPWKVV